MDASIRIERMTNGFTVRMTDPAIVKANNKRDSSNGKGPYIPYRSPEREFVFTTEAEVLAFIKKNLKKVMPSGGDEFETSFDLAANDPDD